MNTDRGHSWADMGLRKDVFEHAGFAEYERGMFMEVGGDRKLACTIL